jgi:hypothetical protein
VFRLLTASPRDICIINLERCRLTELRCKASTGALTFMPNVEARGQSLLSSSRTNGPEPGLRHGFTARFPCSGAQALDEVKVYLLCTRI